MTSLGIVTAVTTPSVGFAMTRNSVEQLHNLGCPIDWHIIIGVSDDTLEAELQIAELILGENLHTEYETGTGIYSATNQGLDQIESDFFVVLHCGDILYPSILEQLPSLNTQFVHAFGTDWHTPTEERAIRRTSTRFQPWLGRMPHHQTMIFPRFYANRPYQQRFPISADQDLKLEIWRSGKLIIHPEVIGSSLIGGLTTRKIGIGAIVNRFLETRGVLLVHFPRFWAELVALGYGFRYAINSFGIATFHQSRNDSIP